MKISNSNVSLYIPPPSPSPPYAPRVHPSCPLFLSLSCICRSITKCHTPGGARITERKETAKWHFFFLLFFKSEWSQRCPVNDNINEQNWNCIGQKSGCNAMRRPKRKGNGQTSIKCRSQLQEMTHLHCYLVYAKSTNFLLLANSLVHNMYDLIHYFYQFFPSHVC